jgi:hypothetical protein
MRAKFNGGGAAHVWHAELSYGSNIINANTHIGHERQPIAQQHECGCHNRLEIVGHMKIPIRCMGSRMENIRAQLQLAAQFGTQGSIRLLCTGVKVSPPAIMLLICCIV